MIDSGTIYSLAAEAGFELCGIARRRMLDEHKGRLNRWLADGLHSGLGYMERNAEKRLDPAALVDNARTVIVCGVNYKNDAWDSHALTAPCKVASYAFAPDYHHSVKEMLSGILDGIKKSYPNVNGRCFTDTAPLLEKAWAVEAGLGWIGRNSLLITPQYGSTVLLGEIVIDMEVDKYDTPFTEVRCGNCTLCINNCPAGALLSDRTLDTGKCVSRLTIEKGSTGPSRDTHGWLFGCDACQSCCPFNARVPRHTNPRFAPVINPARCTPGYWSSLTEADFIRTFARTPLSRTGFDTIKARLEPAGK